MFQPFHLNSLFEFKTQTIISHLFGEIIVILNAYNSN